MLDTMRSGAANEWEKLRLNGCGRDAVVRAVHHSAKGPCQGCEFDQNSSQTLAHRWSVYWELGHEEARGPRSILMCIVTTGFFYRQPSYWKNKIHDLVRPRGLRYSRSFSVASTISVKSSLSHSKMWWVDVATKYSNRKERSRVNAPPQRSRIRAAK